MNSERKAVRPLQSRGLTAAAAQWRQIIKSFLLLVVSNGQERTHHGMSFLLLTEGKTFARTLSAFRATPEGQSLLRRRPSYQSVYGDLARLESYPSRSLGRAYAEFMNLHDLDPAFYLGKAIEQSIGFNDFEHAWFHLRVDANHDLRHVVSGYGADTLGEVCLLWFRFGQIRHWGIFALAVLGVLGLGIAQSGLGLSALREAYKRGHRARNLDLAPWEDELDRPLSEHRAALGLTRPLHYPSSVEPEAYVQAQKEICTKGLTAISGALS